MKKVRGVTPGYEKMQADSSHQQRMYQKVLLGYRSGRVEQGTPGQIVWPLLPASWRLWAWLNSLWLWYGDWNEQINIIT